MKILKSTDEQETYIEDRLEAYNEKRHPLTQERPAVVFSYTALEGQDVIGGIIGYASLYKIGYIDTLWVNEKYRHKSIGTQLLKKVEEDLRTFGCEIVHLETFDFQGPEFYKANHYTEFGRLEYPTAQVTEMFLKKDLRITE
ncbi:MULTISPECIES: GNAT family N-acetyltransferase [Lacticaseibacillus]|uniref:GNAT family N-acetyltransferase n=2 Tax=Lacticaseibacillus TaxID=2759736 RepID=A0AAN1EXQ4_LACCA|nr:MULTISPECIES: GNAT family N-acetyltransferase [Lacticaseibacillus]ARY90345.1 hypothetical protein BGL52_00655 [Lacticaseibacillus casei]KAB1969910.1 GNAT family N-acetyltransferase [Lacticaseibacillus casei]WLV80963.1 GNAT family N-acetyltransferase [Lacticaseibacillus sp. NCIMB 15473]WNX24922.1 GNAT family N-acetyltransferase [Lacticaseibacillus casei]WNX27693.1 GNAT family N-acetyltransferase [Lacticaseibacillus casei]